MRFKAKLMNDQLALLHAVISPISRLQDVNRHFAVLYLDEEYIRISCKSESGITCFAELSQKELFVEHRIESAADNVIVCQVDLVSFKLALQSVVGGGGGINKQQQRGSSHTNNKNSSNNNVLDTFQQEVVILKLAKRNRLPCLCLEGRHAQSDLANHDVEIHQAIPVTILRKTEMQNHLPPQINIPQVQLELPMDRPIRPVIEKLKAMGQQVFLEGNMKGDLTIRLDHDGASMACFYNQLIPRWQEEDEENVESGTTTVPNANASCIVKVDSHKLSTCLQWQQQTAQQQQWQLPVTSCLLGMVQNEMLVLHVLLMPEQVGFLTYYLPVHFLHEDMT
mmetsp:Transcript_54161/g.60558  ORF Transcript_54161/g.60558 Transcript_54161/m.60558 type:complete len:337 (+) Transcript_54161:147-1157(+)|eukprot:CAMPEP_0170798062 /NCGR_PEP_ID=MMETSP0733-20121128/26066_1 /TAXON_ID=186038 /ORGANISM="Fragilariopsis kerguelensis, Strain L26-C5" /LENGTH=336 /DNA_ID=CAMNT_0011149211 /DNA_START=143 /DNA_END=1153 /DNA_ORIENTATION=+